MNRELKKILIQAAYLAAVAGTTIAVSFLEFAFLRNPELRNLPRCAWRPTRGICNADEPGHELITRNTIINTALNLGVFPLARLLHNEGRFNLINLIRAGLVFNLFSLPIANLARYLTMPSLETNEAPGLSNFLIFSIGVLTVIILFVLLLPFSETNHNHNEDRMQRHLDRLQRARQERAREEIVRKVRVTKKINKFVADNNMTQLLPENLSCYDYCFLKLIEDNLENFTKLLNFLASNKINFDDFAKRFGPLGLRLSILKAKSLIKKYHEKQAKAGNDIIAENLLDEIFKQQLGFYVGDIEQYRKNMPKVPPKSARPKAARPN